VTLDLTKPVTTRDGQPVTILKTDLKTTTGYTILGYATAKDGTQTVRVWDPQGRVSYGRETNHDLVNVPSVIKGWINIYNDGDCLLHSSKETADRLGASSRIACIYVEFEEGQGL
jgi:hypothetical protein